MAEFVDRFGGQAESYAAARPTYPEALFAFLADNCPNRQSAWDCATGNGQAAVALAEHFKQVIATDASEAQLVEAVARSQVTYRVATADDSGLETGSVDLVTVAQALHWFDRRAFFVEADRVLRPGGLLAVWTYNLHTISPDVDRVVLEFHNETLNGYWTTQRRLVDEGYASIQFPYETVNTPSFQMETRWPLGRLIAYLRSWSAVGAYTREHSEYPVPVDALAEAWGDVGEREVRWPLAVYIRRKA